MSDYGSTLESVVSDEDVHVYDMYGECQCFAFCHCDPEECTCGCTCETYNYAQRQRAAVVEIKNSVMTWRLPLDLVALSRKHGASWRDIAAIKGFAPADGDDSLSEGFVKNWDMETPYWYYRAACGQYPSYGVKKWVESLTPGSETQLVMCEYDWDRKVVYLTWPQVVSFMALNHLVFASEFTSETQAIEETVRRCVKEIDTRTVRAWNSAKKLEC